MAVKKKPNSSLFEDNKDNKDNTQADKPKNPLEPIVPPGVTKEKLAFKVEVLEEEIQRLSCENDKLKTKILGLQDDLYKKDIENLTYNSNKKTEHKNDQSGIINNDIDAKLFILAKKLSDIENKINIILTSIKPRDNNQDYPTWEHKYPGGFGPVWS